MILPSYGDCNSQFSKVPGPEVSNARQSLPSLFQKVLSDKPSSHCFPVLCFLQIFIGLYPPAGPPSRLPYCLGDSCTITVTAVAIVVSSQNDFCWQLSPCWQQQACSCRQYLKLKGRWGENAEFRVSYTQIDRFDLFCLLVLFVGNELTFQFSSVQLLSHVQLFVTPWIAAHQASLSVTNYQSSLRLTSIESVMLSSHLILCRPLLLLPPIPPSIRVFSNESTLRMRWPKYCSFSFSIIPSEEIPGLISFRMDWLDLLAVQGTLKSLLQHHCSKASILWCSAFFTVQLSHPYMKPFGKLCDLLHTFYFISNFFPRKFK